MKKNLDLSCTGDQKLLHGSIAPMTFEIKLTHNFGSLSITFSLIRLFSAKMAIFCVFGPIEYREPTQFRSKWPLPIKFCSVFLVPRCESVSVAHSSSLSTNRVNMSRVIRTHHYYLLLLGDSCYSLEHIFTIVKTKFKILFIFFKFIYFILFHFIYFFLFIFFIFYFLFLFFFFIFTGPLYKRVPENWFHNFYHLWYWTIILNILRMGK